MSSSPVMAMRQVDAEQANYWMAFPTSSSTLKDTLASPKAKDGDTSTSADDAPIKVRKPYTITKQRERWTDDEHQKFLDALKLHGRAWRRIEDHIGTKTAVQIRSHAQKFFSKLEREASLGGGSLATSGSGEIEIPPPRPKRKPSHPYPKKALGALSNSPSFEEDSKSPPAVYSAFTPLENSKGTTKFNLIPKKAESSAASLRLFGQTVVQGVDKVEADNDLMESTGSPRSQISIGTEETSGTSPIVSNMASVTWDQSTLLDEQAITETKSLLYNAIPEWEKSLIAAHVPHLIGGHHMAHPLPAFWQGFLPPSFAHATNDGTNTSAAIAAATYAVASAWQALQGALITNASRDSNTNTVYSPIAILAAAGQPIPVSRPKLTLLEQQRRDQGGHYQECGNDSEGTPEESSAECCSSLTDSSRPSSYESNDERTPAKKRQRKFLDDDIFVHDKSSEALQSVKCERALKIDTVLSHSEDFDNLQKSTAISAIHSRSTQAPVDGTSENIQAGQSLFDMLMQPEEDNLHTRVMDVEQPLSSIIQACGFGLPTETEEGSFKARGMLKENVDLDKEIISSSSACDEASKSCISKQGVEQFSNRELKDVNGLQFSVNGPHTESGEHLFLIKAGATLSSRYSGVGFVPYRKSIMSDSPSKHEE